MDNYKMWIGGKWVEAESGQTFATFNPATGEEIARIPRAGQTEVDKAVAAARQAFPVWSRMTCSERLPVLNRIAAAIRENAAELIRLEVLEHGTPIGDAGHAPMMSAGNIEFAANAARTLLGEVIPTVSHTMTLLQRVPVGVCAIITPWNHALGMMAVKLAQALAAGNTCVVKPPSVNSLRGLKVAEILDKVEMPPGVVNIITGPGSSTGQMLASHPGVDLIGFTGSSETGKVLMAAGSPTIKRMIMELGGKNPVIVLEDADIDAAVKHLGPRQFHNAGMHCSGAGRYYIHEKVYDEFVGKFVDVAKNIAVGDPADNKTFMGPVASREHRDRVEAYIRSGIEEGAKLLLGGQRPTKPPLDRGFFVMPTIITGVTQNMKIAREEIFGPVAVIMEKFSSEEKVIELANDTRYGLTATVFTRDMAKGMRFVNQLNAGTVSVNTQILTPDLPWGGFKESGIGKEGGLSGIKEYTQLKLVCLKYT